MMFRRVGADPTPQNPEEKLWQLKVFGVASLDQYTEEDFMDDEELEIVARIFGLYLDKKTPTFGKMFSPATHSEYESKE
jgi:hypothetical protein